MFSSKLLRSTFGVFLGLLVSVESAMAASPVQTVTLQDFETGTPTVAEVDTSNSSASGRSYSTSAVVTESGSRRLKMADPGGGVNGIVLSLPNAFTEPGFYLITADIKVDSTNAGPISTFGMAAKLGNPGTAKVLDGNAGYLLNLDSHHTAGAVLGYQTVGAAIKVPAGGTFPQTLTLYFSTDPSGSPTDAHGDFSAAHRGSGQTLPVATNSSVVYIDNIKRIGPGNFGEERHAWISVSDSLTNFTALDSYIDRAFANGFNCIDVLVRYRANHYYTPNREFSDYPNNEPYVKFASASNDPIQLAIDRGHELGMRVYGSFSTFLVTDNSDTWPSYVPANTRTYVYVDSATPPKLQTVEDGGEGLWMDAGLDTSHAYVKNIVLDLVQNYDLDGLIFDRMRYAGNSFGYNPAALLAMGYNPNFPPMPSDAGFIAARQKRVAAFLEDIYQSITDLKPWMIVGTVPVAYGDGLNDTYRSVMQSWPKWTAAPSHNRVISFGAEDLIQPQFYRQWDGGSYAAPLANQSLMKKALYGDVAVDPMDYGLMPGSYTNVAPLFYTGTIADSNDAANTANAIAVNICDTKTASYFMNGSGIYSARGIFDQVSGQNQSIISLIHTASTSCGGDVMGSVPPLSDFLMKAGWDSTPPLGVASPAATPNGIYAHLSWTAPPSAIDGDFADHYLIYYSSTNDVKPYYANLWNKKQVITGTSVDVGPFEASGNYYFRIVPVDDYNNKGASVVLGPVTVQSINVIVESNRPDKSVTPAPAYSETSGAMAYTSSKSTLPGLTGDGARYGFTANQVATFKPNLPVTGGYNVYVTMGAGSNNNADADFTITGSEAPVTGSVALKNSNTDLVNQWYLLAGNVKFNAGQSGSVAFKNITGTASTGKRFVMDAVRFQLVTSGVDDWQLY